MLQVFKTWFLIDLETIQMYSDLNVTIFARK